MNHPPPVRTFRTRYRAAAVLLVLLLASVGLALPNTPFDSATAAAQHALDSTSDAYLSGFRLPFVGGPFTIVQGPSCPEFSHQRVPQAIDFVMAEGTELVAVQSGKVIFVGQDGNYGNQIRVQHDNGLISWYSHIQNNGFRVGNGERVQQGQLIALSGNTGYSTGPHLHFEIRRDNSLVPIDTLPGISWNAERGGRCTGSAIGGSVQRTYGAVSNGHFALLSLNPGHLEIFHRTDDNELRHRWSEDGGTTWNDWHTMSRQIRGAPVVATWDKDFAALFTRGLNNKIYWQSWSRDSGRSEWRDLDGTTYDDIMAISIKPEHLEVYHRGLDGFLYQKYTVDGGKTWSGWTNTGQKTHGRPVVTSSGSDRIDVVVRGEDDNIHHRYYQDGEGWSSWQNLGGTTRDDIAAVSAKPGHLEVYHRGLDGSLYQKYTVDGGKTWYGWTNTGQKIKGAPAVTTPSTDHIGIVVRGDDDVPHYRSYQDGEGWSSWQNLGGITHHEPGIIASEPGSLDAIHIGTDGNFYHMLWRNGKRVGWVKLSEDNVTTPTTVTPVPTTVTPVPTTVTPVPTTPTTVTPVPTTVTPVPTTVTPVPTTLALHGVVPSSGVVGIDNTLVIHGSGFKPGATIRLGSTTLTTTYNSSSSLMAVIPATTPAGTHTVTVRNPDGATVQRSNAYSLVVATLNDDLYVQLNDLFTVPHALRAGEPMKVGAAVTRRGGKQTLSNVKIAFYSEAADGTRTLLGTGTIPRLSVRTPAPVSVAIDLTAPLPAGAVTLVAVVDPDNAVREDNEQNNEIRHSTTVLTANPAGGDLTAPRVDDLTLDGGSSTTTDRDILIDVTASDPNTPTAASGISGIYFVEYYLLQEVNRWVPVQTSSEQVPYATARNDYPWQLVDMSGMHYIQAWAYDNAGNVSLFPFMQQISYVPPTDRVSFDKTVVTRQELSVGDTLTVTLNPTTGDPDLFVWTPRTDDGVPPYVSNLSNGDDVVQFTVTSPEDAGMYQIEVYGNSVVTAEYTQSVTVTRNNAASVAANTTDPTKTLPDSPAVPLDSVPGSDIGLPPPTVQPAAGGRVYLPMLVKR